MLYTLLAAVAFAIAPVHAAALVPTITTATQSGVTSTSATLGGNVTSDGGAAITQRGVVYSVTSLNGNPLLGGTGVTKVVEGSTATGVFTTAVTGLTGSASYSYKAYAINSTGTSYTSVGTFTTGNAAPTRTVSYDFSTDPVAAGLLEVGGNGVNPAPWVASGGNPGGFLALTYPVGYLFNSVVFDNLADGKIVTAFNFKADLRLGNSTGDRAGDGFSISLARADDPVLASPGARNDRGNSWAGGVAEGGTTTGIAIDFDTWSGNTLPDGPDIEGIIVRVDNVTLLKYAMPTRHGAATDITSLQTGPRDAAFWKGGGDPQDPASWAGLSWVPLEVDLDPTGKLTVKYKGATILDKFQTAYFPSPGRIVLAGQTGYANEHTHFDNIQIVTTAAAADLVKPTTPGAIAKVSAGARRVAFTWGASTDDSGRVAYNVYRDGTKVASTLTVTSYVDLGVSPGKTYAYAVEATDISGNLSSKVSTSVTTATEVADVGFLLAEIYDGIGTTATQSLYDDAKYAANTPDRGRYINGLTFGEPNFGDTYGENYGVVIKGVLTAPESGDFDFFVRSDDNSDFFLSANATIPKPGIDTPIAREDGCCKGFQETGGTAIQTTATPIKLVAGQKYGFAFVVKEGLVGDWGQVAMRKVGDTTPAGNLKPIQGALLSGVADALGAVVTITKNPSDVSVPANTSALFDVQATTYSPYTTAVLYQWYKNGHPITGANASSFRVTAAAIADNGAKYKVLVAVPGLAATSTEASLTVTANAPTGLALSAAALAENNTLGANTGQAIPGAIVNPANGHRYVLLGQNTWIGAEAQAVSLGGHLATVNDAAENEWITTTFAPPNYYLWIGLNDAALEGHFEWSSGEPVTYSNWYQGEPNNYGGDENHVLIYNFDSGHRQWNDAGNGDGNSEFPILGVAEIDIPGTTIGTLSAVDPDIGDSHTFSLVAGPGSTDNAAFIIDGAALKIKGVADFEAKNTYSVRIRATDAGGLTYTKSFTITVSNVDEAPVGVADILTRPDNSRVAKVAKAVLLSNDSDPEGATLSITGVGNALPSGSTVVLAGNFAVYTAPSVASGDGSFSYTVADGTGHSSSVTVTVTQVSPSTSTVGPNSSLVLPSGADMVLKWIGTAGRTYRIQYTTHVSSPYTWNDFSPMATVTAAGAGTFSYIDAAPSGPIRLYRAIPYP